MEVRPPPCCCLASNGAQRRGERSFIAGGNGAGKSTLSALLARADAQSLGASGDFRILGEALGMSPACPATSSVADQARPLLPRDGVGWVSTELHLSMARSSRLAIDVLQGFRMPGSKADELSLQVARWLGLSAAAVLQRPFSMLSQGEQKLVLIGAAIAKRPELLVLDEPCQGLDTVHRTRVLSLVNRVCSVSNTTLIYITHHYEEVLPCVSHVMHLQQGQPSSQETEKRTRSRRGCRRCSLRWPNMQQVNVRLKDIERKRPNTDKHIMLLTPSGYGAVDGRLQLARRRPPRPPLSDLRTACGALRSPL